ncbi:NAD(P)-binding protein [Plenodomus tracheiphilus IPT5]|uniref:NAD(P)-binding protein n=1 Tax=Plenodomus tracheiphilus IPT5 TaxID=1408161 RepID=A0A6A7BGT3_9PLEO|nr:NAD(P)-binding protein [Plenodomus tracheiphilus IPT5]
MSPVGFAQSRPPILHYPSYMRQDSHYTMASDSNLISKFDDTDLGAVTWVSQLTQTCHRSLYPHLDPSNQDLSATGKTVLITGVSGGVGRAIAEAWTLAGAEGIVITARRVDLLQDVEARLNEIGKGKTKVLVVRADIARDEDVAALWEQATKTMGPINVLINNAGSLNQAPAGEIEPTAWWQDFEVNVKAVYLNVHQFVKQSPSVEGTIITVTTNVLGECNAGFSSYTSSKLAQVKFMEFLHAEQPNIRSFSMIPGVIATDMVPEEYKKYAIDDPLLPGGLTLYLSTKKADWLRGNVISVNWDFDEMEAHRKEIEEKKLLKLKFTGAKFGKGGHPWESSA